MQFAPKMLVLYVPREDEFAPLKNARGSADSAPEHARAALLDYHRRLLEKAGAKVSAAPGEPAPEVEIVPIVSYDGEGLEAVRGTTIQSPLLIADFATLHALAVSGTTTSMPSSKFSHVTPAVAVA